MNLITGRLKKIKRLNIAGSIHNHKLFNHIHKTSNTSHRRKKGSEYKRHKERKVLKRQFHYSQRERVVTSQLKTLALGSLAAIQAAELKECGGRHEY